MTFHMKSLPPTRDEREKLHLIAWVLMIIAIAALILTRLSYY